MPSKIEWTDEVWNPVIGCSKVSPGCAHCYAERMAGRLAWMDYTEDGYDRVVHHRKGRPLAAWNGKLEHQGEKAMMKPLHWKKPRRVFVNSMSDLFHEKVKPDWILQVWRVMFLAPQHTFQILTKRPEQMRMILTEWLPYAWQLAYLEPWLGVLPNVWLGVSVEDQQRADERVPVLLETPAAVRFLSCEPLLGPIVLSEDTPEGLFSWLDGGVEMGMGSISGRELGASRIDWVIAGGESGPEARPMHQDWVRGLRDQCQAAQVPFFFKQWGEFVGGTIVADDGYANGCYLDCSAHGIGGTSAWMSNRFPACWVGKKEAGRVLDGREWNEFPKGTTEHTKGEVQL